MGDQVGLAVSGSLYYVSGSEFDRLRAWNGSAVEKTQLFAALCRINTLYMIACAGSGHIGSSFSSLDMMAWLQLNEIAAQDVFFSSKGHDAPGYYSTCIGLGTLDFDLLHRLRQLGGLPGHPDVSTPGIATNTGSLGMGISKAKGMIYANRRLGKKGRVFVLTGDGELQEGQIWESLISAANHALGELMVIVDHNKLQSDTLVRKVSDLGDLEKKFAAFGWHVERCDGNDLEAFAAALERAKGGGDRPKVLIADTIKGKGVSFMEHTAIDSDVELYAFHSGAPSADNYIRAAQELIDGANALCVSCGLPPLMLETTVRPATPPAADKTERLIPAYTEALLEQAKRNPTMVALDADLILDTGLIAFEKQFPDQFVECGIAEQDMVSQAGGMALRGLLPVVHSFSCFLSARPNEQIYNNATEHTKIVYVGSLAGLLPAGPGHSHQAVRDISALAAIPGLTLLEPSCAAEVPLLLDWCLNQAEGSSYLRLISIPYVRSYALPSDYRPHVGRGAVLHEGGDAVVIAYGPLLLEAAMQAARMLKEKNIGVKVINLPWLNVVDFAWLKMVLGSTIHVFSLDNHYRIGGQGDRLAEGFAGGAIGGKQLHRLALESIPASGGNADVLAHHHLDAASIAEAITCGIR